jgi:peroxiredoxin
MATTNRQGRYWITAALLTLVLTLGLWEGCRRQTPSAAQGAPSGGKATPAAAKEDAPSPLEAAANLFREPRASIQNIVRAANERWTPVCQSWWERSAPDFTLSDLEGQTHKLSDYKGKEVIIAFWATSYGGACKLEIPQFKELRNTFPNDKLAMLVISSEPTALLKTFATEQGINYTVLTNSGTLPPPFDQVKVVPTTFFIGADGKIKVAIEGMVPAGDGKAIIQAQ